MTTLRITSWNINSVRLRLPHIATLADTLKPDVLCLQETKVDDPLFPLDDIKALGFEHVVFSGQKSYNGVAILSKVKLEDPATLGVCEAPDKRHISAVLPGGILLHNFYVPAGGDTPDPNVNPAFDFKLRFAGWMRDYFKQTSNQHFKSVLVGDLNIAPYEHDVWSHKQLLTIVSHTPVETKLLEEVRASLDWVDVARHFTPMDEKLYSWWSYRNRDWRKSDRGRRLDHIWVTPALKESLKSFSILKDARDWEKPSDHVPITCELTI